MPSNATLPTAAAPAGFICDHCHQPVTFEDFIDLGLRAPDTGESRDDYFDAELLDSLTHEACIRAR